jgi:hypothetical protein
VKIPVKKETTFFEEIYSTGPKPISRSMMGGSGLVGGGIKRKWN